MSKNLPKISMADVARARLRALDGAIDDYSRENPPEPAKQKPSGMLRRAGDVGLSAVQGAVDLVSAPVGLMSMATGGRAGKALEEAGFRPREAIDILQGMKSPEQQAADAAVQSQDGFVETIGAAMDNPSTIGHAIVRSAPSMLGGGIIARGVQRLAPAVSAAGGAAIGEGLISAGTSAEQIRQQTADGYMTGEQSAIAAGTGMMTGLINRAGGAISKRAGVGDVDTMVAGGGGAAGGGIVKKVAGGAASEGAEEMAQSAQEQIGQNVALGKDPMQGVGNATAMGLLSGGAMGGASGPIHKEPAQVIREHKLPDTGPLSKAVNAGVEAEAQKVEQATAPRAIQPGSVGQEIDQRQGQPRTAGATAGEPTILSTSEPDMPTRAEQLRAKLAEPGVLDAVRAQFGPEGINDLTHYAGIATNPSIELPAKTRDNMLRMAEQMVAASLIDRIEPAPVPDAQPAIGMDASDQPLMIEADPRSLASTGRARVAPDGTVTRETGADLVNDQIARDQPQAEPVPDAGPQIFETGRMGEGRNSNPYSTITIEPEDIRVVSPRRAVDPPLLVAPDQSGSLAPVESARRGGTSSQQAITQAAPRISSYEVAGDAARQQPAPAPSAPPALPAPAAPRAPRSAWEAMSPEQRDNALKAAGFAKRVRDNLTARAWSDLADAARKRVAPVLPEPAPAAPPAAVAPPVAQPAAQAIEAPAPKKRLARRRAADSIPQAQTGDTPSRVGASMESRGWAPETSSPDNSIWTKRVNGEKYTATASGGSIEITVPVNGVGTQIGSHRLDGAADVGELVDKSVSDDIAATSAQNPVQTAAQPVPPAGTHADPGKPAEPVTPSVVSKSIAKAAGSEDRKPSQMRVDLLAMIDKAAANSESSSDNYVRFDVPGDGSFKIRNTKENLARFREQVMKSPGFKDSKTKLRPDSIPSVRNGSGTERTAFENMVEEGDLEASSDYAEAVGLELDGINPKAKADRKVLAWRESQEGKSLRQMVDEVNAEMDDPAPGKTADTLEKKEMPAGDDEWESASIVDRVNHFALRAPNKASFRGVAMAQFNRDAAMDDQREEFFSSLGLKKGIRREELDAALDRLWSSKAGDRAAAKANADDARQKRRGSDLQAWLSDQIKAQSGVDAGPWLSGEDPEPVAAQPAPKPEAAVPSAIPPAVGMRAKRLIDFLNEKKRALDAVQRARGDGHVLALEWEKESPAIKDRLATLDKMHAMASSNGLSNKFGELVESYGGEPDFSMYRTPQEVRAAEDLPPAAEPPSAPRIPPRLAGRAASVSARGQASEPAPAPAPAPKAEPAASLNKRHAIPKRQVLTPRGALKADATASRADSSVWFHQGDMQKLAFTASVIVDGKPDPRAAEARQTIERANAATKAGWSRTNYRAGSLGTVWVFERGDEFLTRAGFENMGAGVMAAPEIPDTEAGYDGMVAQQTVLAKAFDDWLNTLPAEQQENRGVVSRKMAETPVGGWAELHEDKTGLTVRRLKPGGKDWSIALPHAKDWPALRRAIAEMAGKEAPAAPLAATTGAATPATPGATSTAVPGTAGSPAAPAAAPKAKAAGPAEKPARVIDRHESVMDAARAGTASPDEFRAAFTAVADAPDAVKAELSAMTKDKLLASMGPYFTARYKTETKPVIVATIYGEMLAEYAMGKDYGPSSYFMGQRAAYEAQRLQALRDLVANTTADDITAFAKGRAERDAETKAKRDEQIEGLKNPQTLEQFNARIRLEMRNGAESQIDARMKLTPEQRAKYDELSAEATRSQREELKRRAAPQVTAASTSVAGQIVETTHTQKGHDLFVVQLAQRLERDDYDRLNASAKQMGGYYSSFRGRGAVPGFQFRDRANADAFLRLAGGDTAPAQQAVEARRDAFQDDRSQSAVERLREMANRLDDAAQEKLDQYRKTNTARRARFAASAMAAADTEKAMSKTMRNIAGAIESGKAKFLDAVRSKSQVELLENYLRSARDAELRQKYPTYAEQERRKGEPPTIATADHAEFPSFTAFRSDLAALGRALSDNDGTKALGKRLLSTADDVTDAYLEFAKKNLPKVLGRFVTTSGGPAVFANAAAAENAIRRSRLVGKAVVLPIKRGENAIIISPSEAIGQGVWSGDGDKRFVLSAEFGSELVERLGKGKNKSVAKSLPWQFASAHERTGALKRMGVTTGAELRSAIREFIAMREQAVTNKAREMELAMVGRKNDGLDFFPTPAEIADQMVAAAEISPEMSVLEPSAGMGHIADRIRATGAEPDVMEIAADRLELLQEKGYHVTQAGSFLDMKPREFFTFGDVFRAPDGKEGIMHGGKGWSGRGGLYEIGANGEAGALIGWYDRAELTGVRHRGTDSGYDRIVMNPPFSDRRDAEHVRHAYSLLKPGGRLVAIMGEGVFFGQDKRAAEFREWFDSVGGTDEKLPPGSFMDPSLPVTTGVSARLVVIDRPLGSSPSSQGGVQGENAVSKFLGNTADTSSSRKKIINAREVNQKLSLAVRNLNSALTKRLNDGVAGDAEFSPDLSATNAFSDEIRRLLDVPSGRPAGINSDILQAARDGASIDAALFGNEIQGGAIRSKGFNSLDPEVKGLVQSSVIASIHDRKVFDSVVELVPVDVMNDLIGKQFSPNGGLDNKTMLGSLILASRDMPVLFGRFVDSVASSTPLGLATAVAEKVGMLGDNMSVSLHGISAATAKHYGHEYLRESTSGDYDTNSRMVVIDKPAADSAPDATRFSRNSAMRRSDARAPRGIDLERVTAVASAIRAQWPGSPDVVVLANMDDPLAPEAVREEDRLQRSGGAVGGAEGFWHGGKVYLVAGSLRTEGDIARVLAHEVLGHHGLRGMFGPALDGILSQIVSARRGEVEAMARRYGLDTKSRADMLQAAEEVLAYMAQTKPELGFVRRAVAAIRSFLRGLGIGLRMSDDEIVRDFILPARGWVERGGVAAGQATRFSRQPGNQDTQTDRPTITGGARDLAQSIGRRLSDFRGIGLQMLGRRQLTEVYGSDIPQLEAYSRMVTQMEADKNEIAADADEIAQVWGKLPDATQLAELMHEATLSKIDADPIVSEDTGGVHADALRAKFKALSPEAQGVYRRARDIYSAHFDQMRVALRQRIERAEGISSERRTKLLNEMDAEFFKGMQGVYFPLARFGDYVVVVRGQDGTAVSVSRAETQNEAHALRKAMLEQFSPADGFTVSKVLKGKEYNAARDAVGRGFMASLFEAIGSEAMPDSRREELKDMLGQLYLSARPDTSWAKHGLHRKGTPGFSSDARRAFAQNVFHGARSLAKMRYADRLESELDKMQKHVDGSVADADYDSVKAQQVVDEMVKRHDVLMSPPTNPLSTTLTSVGFLYHMGLSPASALVNLTQTALVAYPIMGARWGFARSAAALLKASNETASAKNDLRGALSGEEADALQQAIDAGTIDVTMAHDLAGIAQGEDSGVMWKMRPVMRAASFMFHHAERFNRQATFIAAYRMAREDGSSHRDAVDAATKATYDAHFDLSSANRPRAMSGNVARVVLLFKSFAQNMIYTLGRAASQSMKGDREAQKRLAGILAMHLLFAGALGLPGIDVLLGMASMIGGGGDDEWDANIAMRNTLADAFGPEMGDVIAHGLSRATPWDISGRVGLDKLILPDVQEGLEGARWVESFSTAALGPVAGIGLNVAKGLQDIQQGHVARGVESMLPVAVRSPMKALRYEMEGAVDKTGVPIADDVSAAGVAGQALGFSPTEVRRAQEVKSAIFKSDKRLVDRRAALVSRHAMAAMTGDEEDLADVRERIAKWNATNPDRRISPRQLSQSVRQRNKRIAQAKDGVYLPNSREDAREAVKFGGYGE